MIYLQLFLSFLQIGAFSFGGGYAAMPLIQNQVVDLHHWLNLSEFTDLVTISQMTPGPIAINSATFVGTRIAGAPGALAATVGCVLPSCILVTLLARILKIPGFKHHPGRAEIPAPGCGCHDRRRRRQHPGHGILGPGRFLPQLKRPEPAFRLYLCRRSGFTGPVPDESDSCHGPVRRGRDRLSAGYEGPLKCLIDFNPFPL